MALSFFSGGARAFAAADANTTITSDVLELRNSGEETIFRGHVVLTSDAYVLKARRMQQDKATGIVNASGKVDGVWHGANGEKYHGIGDHATYNPNTKVARLWGHAQVTRWETAVDTNPVVAFARTFVADQLNRTVEAHTRVRITRGPQMVVQADEAKYIDAQKILYLWGGERVKVHYQSVKGTADFISDRGMLMMDLKRARLLDNVQGHISPAR